MERQQQIIDLNNEIGRADTRERGQIGNNQSPTSQGGP